jgi:hypothetical protein
VGCESGCEGVGVEHIPIHTTHYPIHPVRDLIKHLFRDIHYYSFYYSKSLLEPSSGEGSNGAGYSLPIPTLNPSDHLNSHSGLRLSSVEAIL